MDDFDDLPRLRERVHEALARENVDPCHRDVVVLVLGELVTNALGHGLPPRALYVGTTGPATVVSVTDAGPGRPVRRDADASSREGGFGLNLVDRLASAWGVIEQRGAKNVWALIAHEPTT